MSLVKRDLFSIPFLEKKILDIDNQDIITYCNEFKKQNSGKVVSNFGGWQSENFITPPKELKNLFLKVSEFAKESSDLLEINSVNISSAWININYYKDFNWDHIHPGATLSGIYYVKTPKNCGNLEIENPLLRGMNLKITQFNSFNGSKAMLPCHAGVAYIFPAWLYHKVYPNMNETEERISIAFNFS